MALNMRMGHVTLTLPQSGLKIKTTIPRIRMLGATTDCGPQPLMSVGRVRVAEHSLCGLEAAILARSRARELDQLGPSHQYQATIAPHNQDLQQDHTCRMSTAAQFQKFQNLPGGGDLWKDIRRMYPGLAVKYLVRCMRVACMPPRACVYNMRARNAPTAVTRVCSTQDVLVQGPTLDGASTFGWHEVSRIHPYRRRFATCSTPVAV